MAKKTIFNTADGILTSCNEARSWHWFRQVTAPCNVACGSGIMTVKSPSGSTLQRDTWLWDDMPLNSPGGSTLHWHVALGSWHWIRQVAAPCNVAGSSGMTCHWIRPNVRHIGILHLVSISTTSLQSCNMSFCTSLRHFIQIGPTTAEKNDVMSIFKMADLSHLGF